MKKLTVLFIAVLFASAAFSQGRFRLQAGPVLDYLRSEGNGYSFPNLELGYTFGAAYEMVTSNHFSIQPELNYSVLNTVETVNSSKIKLQYVQIPVLLKFVNDHRTFSFYLGPQLGLLANANSRTSGKNTDIKDQLTQNDFSGMAGMEFAFTHNILLNVRYTQGFSNVIKVEFDSPSKTRMEAFGLVLTYAFDRKKK